MSVYVFCGPTITADEVTRRLPDAVVLPPISHGDLLRLSGGPRDTVVIVDGVFHQSAAVRHKEILLLLAAGVRVIGSSSMGALRAAELDRYGMIGIGRVYAMYRDGVTDADADVAVTHTDGSRVRGLSVAMVDVLALTADAVSQGVIGAADRDRIIAVMAAMHYTDRDWRMLRSFDGTATTDAAFERFSRWLADRPGRGVKYTDAVEALEFAARPASDTPAEAPEWTNRRWRSEHVRDWSARFVGRTVAGRHIPFLAQVQHQQIYDPSFAARRRRYVLAWVAGLPAAHGLGDAELADRALAAAEERGMALAHLSSRQRRFWLTEAENNGLDPSEALLRILVRSVRTDAATAGWPDTPERVAALLNPGLDSAAAVSHAYRVNDRATDQGVAVHRLDGDFVKVYLRRLWQLDQAGSAELTAAARDRGFGDFAAAATICHQFVLAAMGERLWRHLSVTSPG